MNTDESERERKKERGREAEGLRRKRGEKERRSVDTIRQGRRKGGSKG
jgi:hypothetical protein